jgi:hydroxypyruvate reductase
LRPNPCIPFGLSLSKPLPRWRFDKLSANGVLQFGYFEALGDSAVTGPTLTNVNDFRAIFIGR